jgi:hypothetical protein
MSATLQQDCYAALWCAIFHARHSLDRYAGQGELFNRDRGPEPTAPASPTWPDPDDAADPGFRDPPAPGRSRPQAFHEPDAAKLAEARQGAIGASPLKTEPRERDPFPWVPRDDQHSWRPTTGLFPDRDSAHGALAQAKSERGYHTGHVVPSGDFWRVNVLYRYPHVQYPEANQ